MVDDPKVDDEVEGKEEALDLSEFYYPEQNEIGLLHHHLRELPDFSAYQNLEKLILRQNLLTTLLGLECLTKLKSLDCYLNNFERIDNVLLKMVHLQWLDFSFNSIRVIEHLDNLRNLHKLYLVNNKIKKMNGLRGLTKLKMLELGSNRIRVIEGLDDLVELEELWLGKNKIRTLENMDKLVRLRLLSIQSNRITSIGTGLQYQVNLQEVYISHNGLQNMDEGLLYLTNLKTLDMAGNFITKIENLQNCTKLKELWMNDNKVDSFEGLSCITSKCMSTIYLERNPIQTEDEQKYQKTILSAFPTLTQLDAMPLRNRMRANKIEAQIKYKSNADQPATAKEQTETD